MSKQNTTPFEIELVAMAHGGSALGRHTNQTVFIPYTIPGEVVLAQIVQDKGRIAFAQGLQLIEASADRVYPECPHFGPNRCGRCQWQHIDYAAQVLLKQDVLNDQLARVGGIADDLIEAAVHPVVPSDVIWGYNYHMTLEVTPAGTLAFTTPDRAPFTVEECHILHPALLTLLHQIDLDVSGISKIRLQIGTDGAHMLILSIKDEENIPELATDLATSVNVLLEDNEPVNLIGDSHSRYHVNGRDFRVTAGSWFRAHIAQLPHLAQIVLDALALTGTETVLDLYAGVGFFSAFIAPHASFVTLIEDYPPAATDADENLADFEHIELIEGTAEDVLPTLDAIYQAAIIDPPQNGLSLEALDALLALKIPRLVYVSSDPATLARDAKRLLAQGYTLAAVQPIDLAPQTYFVDSVSTFIAKI